ncbi:MAG: transporter substrate-binding domain-containing protein, partial [Deltaproteobacteria bacterium]|nr:transporter substrate-binding domain-containing protein [Deltaproteobacteria bacterium]
MKTSVLVRLITSRLVRWLISSLLLSLVMSMGLVSPSFAEKEAISVAAENSSGHGQEVADKIASITRRAIYNLDSDQLMAVIENYLDENHEIQSLHIVENIDQEVLLTYFRRDNRPVYNQPIPDNLFKLDAFIATVLFEGDPIGTVTIHYVDAPSPAADSAKAAGKGLSLTDDELTWLKLHPVLRVHNEKNWAPFNFFEDNSPRGLSIDYMNLLAEKLGLTIAYQTGPGWNGFLQQIRKKQLDVMLNIVKTEDRQKYILFTEPYAKNPNVIVSRNDAPVNTFSELTGRKVDFPKGFFYEEVLTREYPEIKRLPLKDTLATLRAVALGKADAALGEDAVMRRLISENLLTNLYVSGEADLGHPDFVNLRIGVRDDWPLLHTAIEKAMQDVTGQEMNTIQQRWLLKGATSSVDRSLQSSYSLSSLVVGCIIFILVMLVLLKLFRRLGYRVEKRLLDRGNLRLAGLVAVASFLTVFLVLAWFALERMDRQLRAEIGDTLIAVNHSVKESMEMWLENRSREIKHLANDRELLPLTLRLLALSRDSETILSSKELAQVRALYQQHMDEMDARGFFIIAPDHVSIGSMRDSNVGTP